MKSVFLIVFLAWAGAAARPAAAQTTENLYGIWNSEHFMFALEPGQKLEIIWHAGFFGEGQWSFKNNTLEFVYTVNSSAAKNRDTYTISNFSGNGFTFFKDSGEVFTATRMSGDGDRRAPGGGQTCHYCAGNGKIQCPDCNGEGRKQVTGYDANGRAIIEYETCYRCKGQRRITCDMCNGTGKAKW